jgi:hypothetical protein
MCQSRFRLLCIIVQYLQITSKQCNISVTFYVRPDGGEDSYCCLLDYDTVQFGMLVLTPVYSEWQTEPLRPQ